MTLLVDTHCHLNLEHFSHDCEIVISDAISNGVGCIIVPGVDLETSAQAVKLAEKHPIVYAAVGFHPSEAYLATTDGLKKLEALAASPKVVAIGEIGLDFFHSDNPSESIQIAALVDQFNIAANLSLPVIIHSRDALEKIIPYITRASIKAEVTGVMHAFEGTASNAMTLIEAGYKIGIGGPVTYSNAIDKHNLAAVCPLTSIVLETDAPYLAPSPHRQERNVPSHLSLIAARIASLRQASVEIVTQQTTLNALQLFPGSRLV